MSVIQLFGPGSIHCVDASMNKIVNEYEYILFYSTTSVVESTRNVVKPSRIGSAAQTNLLVMCVARAGAVLHEQLAVLLALLHVRQPLQATGAQHVRAAVRAARRAVRASLRAPLRAARRPVVPPAVCELRVRPARQPERRFAACRRGHHSRRSAHDAHATHDRFGEQPP